jgi:hypothetical protein
MAARGNTTARGYGAKHQALRKRWLRWSRLAVLCVGGVACPSCHGRASTWATMTTTARCIEYLSTATATDPAQHPEATGCEANVGGCRSGWGRTTARDGELKLITAVISLILKREAGPTFFLCPLQILTPGSISVSPRPPVGGILPESKLI